MPISSLMPEAKMTVANLTRRWTCVVAVAVAALGTHKTWADSFALDHAHVVWTQGDRVYIASSDPLALRPATQLTFRYKQDIVATGDVTAVYQNELIAAVITSGSLRKVKHLDKVEITAREPEFHPPTLVRVGYPAPARKNLLFDCVRLEPSPTVLQGAYRSEGVGMASYRFVRDASVTAGWEWPDTLVVRQFDEVTDEEIALERGDIDVAIFWPGEASTHIRDAMGWKGQTFGWNEIYLKATPPRDELYLSDEESDVLGRMNRTLFRGDLLRATPTRSTSEHPPSTRFEVDQAIPGRDTIQRFLNGGVEERPVHASDRVIRLELAAISGGDISPIQSGALFQPRSPVLSTPGLSDYIARLGAGPLVGLFTCLPAGGKP